MVAGVFPQRFRVEPLDYPERIKKRLGTSLASWKAMLASMSNDPGDANRIKAVQETIKVYEQEFAHFGGELGAD